LIIVLTLVTVGRVIIEFGALMQGLRELARLVPDRIRGVLGRRRPVAGWIEPTQVILGSTVLVARPARPSSFVSPTMTIALSAGGGAALIVAGVDIRLGREFRRIAQAPRQTPDGGGRRGGGTPHRIRAHDQRRILSARRASSGHHAIRKSPANRLVLVLYSLNGWPNCHAEGREFESLQPLRFESPAHGHFATRRGNWNHPRISPPFEALVP
jgi:hypothetical protein